MTINLSELNFTNDFTSVPMPKGNTLVMNKVNESLKITEAKLEDNKEVTITENLMSTAIDTYNIVVVTDEGTYLCPAVIGIKNDFFVITSDYEEYNGCLLTSENIQFCKMEIFEDE